MKSEIRSVVDSILSAHLGPDRVNSRAYVFNEQRKKFRRIKYVFLRATDDQLKAINDDLTNAFPNNKVVAYDTDTDPSCHSRVYSGLAVRIYN